MTAEAPQVRPCPDVSDARADRYTSEVTVHPAAGAKADDDGCYGRLTGQVRCALEVEKGNDDKTGCLWGRRVPKNFCAG